MGAPRRHFAVAPHSVAAGGSFAGGVGLLRNSKNQVPRASTIPTRPSSDRRRHGRGGGGSSTRCAGANAGCAISAAASAASARATAASSGRDAMSRLPLASRMAGIVGRWRDGSRRGRFVGTRCARPACSALVRPGCACAGCGVCTAAAAARAASTSSARGSSGIDAMIGLPCASRCTGTVIARRAGARALSAIFTLGVATACAGRGRRGGGRWRLGLLVIRRDVH